MLKKILIMLILTTTLAISNVDTSRIQRTPSPIVLNIEYIPPYFRRRPVKKYLFDDFNELL
jgi:hypothetical protein